MDWYHTLSSQIDIDAQAPRWKLKLLRFRKAFVYKAATYIIAVSEAARRDVQCTFRIQESKCKVFYSALADPLKDFPFSQSVERKQTLFCVGRLNQSKGQDVLIKALIPLKKRFPQINVEFVGSGPYKKTYTELAINLGVAHLCHFLGPLSHPEVLTRMASSAATIVPSRSEAMGLVNIESMAVGTPVVASAVGGIPEIIRDGIDGFCIPPDDPDFLAEKLGQLLSLPALREMMGLNARNHFIDMFEQSKIVKEQADWFEQVIA